MSLIELKSGSRGRVVGLSSTNGPATQKILAMGLVPGRIFTKNQGYPSVIVEIDHATFALDEKLASIVSVTAI